MTKVPVVSPEFHLSEHNDNKAEITFCDGLGYLEKNSLSNAFV